MPSFMDRLKLSYNILRNKEFKPGPEQIITSNAQEPRFASYRYDTAQKALAPIINRIAIDAAAMPVRHVLVDELNHFTEVKESELNDRLSIMANVDQPGPAFIQDAITTMLEAGSCALVPIEISDTPSSGTYDILSMRVATISQWFNYSVEVDVYNELTGNKEQMVLPKSFVAICYNPLYMVMNDTNSTLRRLVEKLALLDVADARLYSQQLDLVLQLPYPLKNERRENEADRRLKTLEAQLYNRNYGIGYIDATEKITQLNRPVTNALVDTVNGLREELYSQLGLTPSIFAGTATEGELVSYNNRTVLPVMKALTDAMVGAFFSRTAIRQGNRIMAFPNLFKMAPLEIFSEAADKLTRNAIMSSNEIRSVVG